MCVCLITSRGNSCSEYGPKMCVCVHERHVHLTSFLLLLWFFVAKSFLSVRCVDVMYSPNMFGVNRLPKKKKWRFAQLGNYTTPVSGSRISEHFFLKLVSFVAVFLCFLDL